jgi:diguanylate cyclase (GGDEF)-like protein
LQKISILYDASQTILSTFELDAVLDQILTIVRDYFHLKSGSILLLDHDTHILRGGRSFGMPPHSVEIAIGQGLCGSAAKIKRPVYAPDVTKDPRYLNLVESTKSEVAIPLVVRDEVVGVLDCQSEEVNFLDTETLDLLTLFATQASIALFNAEIYSKERKRAAQMEAISAIARQATSVLKLEEMLVQLCISIGTSLPHHSVAILTAEEDGTLIHRANGGPLRPLIETSQAILPTRNPAEAAQETRKPQVLRAVQGKQPVLFENAGSELFLPLISAGRPQGVLVVAATSADAFHSDDIAMFESVADICATAIQNAYYFQQVEQLAYVDGLTGVSNRRHFERRIAEEIERAARYDSTLSVIMLDLDHFKKINDEFGHLLGDEVLRSISLIFQQGLRKPDCCCRYGGEEFAIILPETSGPKAVLVAEKLRQLVAAYEFPGVPRPVTISAGVADFPRCGTTRDDLVGAADDSLYLAKQAGRNRVMSPDNMGIGKFVD